MPYEEDKDKEINRREVEVDGVRYVVSLRSYDGKDPKIAIYGQGGRFQIKRLTPKQMVAIAEAIRDWAADQPAG
jgi:hypothetical protein